MLTNRVPTWLAVVLGGAGLLFTGVMGVWVFMSATATPLHPSAQDLPATSRADPLPRWDGAVGQARQIVRAALVEQNLPGVSVAVGSGGDIVWSEGFGFANLEQRAPVTPETRFRIGTASSTLTSAAVGLLMEEKALNLDAEIQSYVPEFPKKPWPVTLRQIMGQVAGGRSDGGDEGELLSKHCERPVDALPFIGGPSLLFEPGTAFHYSIYAGILVSAAVETAAQEPFLRFMRKQVFEPLGMDDTVPDGTNQSVQDRATSYFPRFAGDPRFGPDVMREVDYSCYAGASAFMSTPADLIRFAMAINRGQLLQPATVTLLQAEQVLASGESTGYGLFWDLKPITVLNEPTVAIGHDGDLLGGMAVSFMTLPKYGITVAVTSNTSYADTFTLAVKIAQSFVVKTPS